MVHINLVGLGGDVYLVCACLELSNIDSVMIALNRGVDYLRRSCSEPSMDIVVV